MGYLGTKKNDDAKLEGLISGLRMALENNFTKLIIEGDSQILISALSKTLQGTIFLKIMSS